MLIGALDLFDEVFGYVDLERGFHSFLVYEHICVVVVSDGNLAEVAFFDRCEGSLV